MNTVNTDNVALTQKLSSNVTKNYYTGGTFPTVPSRDEFHRYASNQLSTYNFETDYPPFPAHNINITASAISWTKSNNKNKGNKYNLKPTKNSKKKQNNQDNQ